MSFVRRSVLLLSGISLLLSGLAVPAVGVGRDQPTPSPSSRPSTPQSSSKIPEAIPTGKGTSYDYRFAGVAGNRQAAVQVTPAIPERGVVRGEVILDKTLTINQNATETLAISRAATGYGAVRSTTS
ncbi:hypothetical protein [Kribbella sp. DT2]|uniref:hypothetical protein n=1 Tax=Kribbella sp. DT2 TaxID=3393427 RepID=UPI003CF8BD0B